MHNPFWYTSSALFLAVMALKHGVWTVKRSLLMATGLYYQMINAITNHRRSCHVMSCLVTLGDWNTPALHVEVNETDKRTSNRAT